MKRSLLLLTATLLMPVRGYAVAVSTEKITQSQPSEFGTSTAPSNGAAEHEKGVAAYKRGDYRLALAEFRQSAALGNARAERHLGVMYARGQGIRRNYAKALKWFRLAAAQDNAVAEYDIGVSYANGEGVAQDYATALQWYHLAAVKGYARAEYNLGVMYDKGLGVPQDFGRTSKWYRRAAAQGYGPAEFGLGVIYAEGLGVPRDYRTALRWFHVAAARGYVRAEYNLGVMYSNGYGVAQDYDTALRWYHSAAGQGYTPAVRAMHAEYKRCSVPPYGATAGGYAAYKRATFSSTFHARDIFPAICMAKLELFSHKDKKLSASLRPDGLSDAQLASESVGRLAMQVGSELFKAWRAAKAQFHAQSITVRGFVIKGPRLAKDAAHLKVSGVYVREGNMRYLYANSTDATLAVAPGYTGYVPKITLLTSNASTRARKVLLQCSENPASIYTGCPVTLNGAATDCEEATAFGGSRELPCLEVKDLGNSPQ